MCRSITFLNCLLEFTGSCYISVQLICVVFINTCWNLLVSYHFSNSFTYILIVSSVFNVFGFGGI